MTRYLAVGALGIGLLWVWLSAFAWFDLARFCRIHIDVELLEGDRAGIRQAIALLRRTDVLAYQALCRHVDRIMEEARCDAGDPQADPALRGATPIAPERMEAALLRAWAAPGCYVKGSRIIVLRREAGSDPAVVKRRAEALGRLAGYSQEFWTRERR